MGKEVKISLTRGQFAIIDAEAFGLVSQFKWYAKKARSHYYAAFKGRKEGNVGMHRLIMAAKKGQVVDHINGDTLDNRKSNLRLCTNRQNCFNRTVLNGRNKSGFNGVFYEKKVKKWRVQIQKNGKPKHIGLYENLADAIQSRKLAAAEYYGEFAPIGGGYR